jgi:hypothetical protein
MPQVAVQIVGPWHPWLNRLFSHVSFTHLRRPLICGSCASQTSGNFPRICHSIELNSTHLNSSAAGTSRSSFSFPLSPNSSLAQRGHFSNDSRFFAYGRTKVTAELAENTETERETKPHPHLFFRSTIRLSVSLHLSLRSPATSAVPTSLFSGRFSNDSRSFALAKLRLALISVD